MSEMGTLVLEREMVPERDTIIIGDDIEVEVVRILGGKVRLAVTAPKTIRIDRKEVRIRREREAAASVTPGDVAGAGKGAT